MSRREFNKTVGHVEGTLQTTNSADGCIETYYNPTDGAHCTLIWSNGGVLLNYAY